MASWPANINDLFFTVQGEGANMGRRALFVRMPFCNLACSWCLAPDTPVLMADFTCRPISEVRVGDEVVGYAQVPGKSHRRFVKTVVTNKTEQPSVKRLRIDAQGQQLVCTPDHSLWRSQQTGTTCHSRWRKASKFKAGDGLLAYPAPQVPEVDAVAYGLGYMAGAADGDGTYWGFEPANGARSCGHFKIAVNDVEILDRIIAAAEPLGFSFTKKTHNTTGFSGLPRQMPSLYLLGGQEEVQRFEAELKKSPESADYMRGYLGGIFDAEGSLSEVIRLAQSSTANPDIHARIERYCRALGFDVAAEPKAIRLRGGSEVILRFFAQTQPAVERKRAGLLGRADGVQREVKSVCPEEDGPVMNLTTECGSFVANGLVVKNCDTTFNTYTRYALNDFLAFVDQEPTCKFAVLTGGEPTMNKHLPLIIEALKSRGYELAVESNGMFPIPEGIDFVTVSPKRDATPTPYWVHPDAWAKANEFKYVVDDDFNFALLDRHESHRLEGGRRFSLSPEATHLQRNVERIIEFLSTYPSSAAGWRLNLQTHKWIGVK